MSEKQKNVAGKFVQAFYCYSSLTQIIGMIEVYTQFVAETPRIVAIVHK